MKLPLGSPAPFVLLLLLSVAVATAQEAPPKPRDVMTVNGAQVPAPASVPDLTAPVRADARRAAILAPGARGEPAVPFADARRTREKARTAAAPAAGSLPALLGPLPRPAWGASPVPAEPKPAEVVTVGEPTGLDTPPASAAPAPGADAKPAAAPAKRAAKPVRDLSTSHPRDAAAPPASPAKPEVKR